MGEDTISWWEDLIKSNLEQFEKEVNPHGISYLPPNIWPGGLLERLLAEAYRRENPQATPPDPLPATAINFLVVQLNRAFNERGRGGDHRPRPQLKAYLTQSFPEDSAWNPVDVVQHDTGGNLAAGRSLDINPARTIPEVHKAGISSSSRPIPKESYKSDDATLPFASRSGGSSIGTGVGTSSRPVPGNSTPNKLTRGESETGHSSRRGSRGRTTRAGTRRVSEPTSPSSSKRPRGGVHACSQCHKTFPFPSKLKDHMHIHEETKDFSCGVGSCSKAFKRLRELQAHRKTHGEISTPEPRNVDKEMHDSMGQSPADPEPPDPGLPNKSPQDSKSPVKSPSGEAFRKGSLSTPPRKSPSITHGESPALPTMPKSPEHSGVSQEPRGDDEKLKDDRPRVPLENQEEYLTRMAAGLVNSRP